MILASSIEVNFYLMLESDSEIIDLEESDCAFGTGTYVDVPKLD
jgi:hypothetical protein